MLEIERKFLLLNLSPIERLRLGRVSKFLVVQHYLPAIPGCSVRLRTALELLHPQEEALCTLAVKLDTTQPECRQEYEVVLTRADYMKLRKQASKVLVKLRMKYEDPDTGATWFLDEICPPSGLATTLAETERTSLEAPWPAFPKLLQPLLVREVTDEPQYRSENLAWPLSTTNQENLSCCSTPNPS